MRRLIRCVILSATLLLVASAPVRAGGACDAWERSHYLHPGLGLQCAYQWIMDFTDP